MWKVLYFFVPTEPLKGPCKKWRLSRAHEKLSRASPGNFRVRTRNYRVLTRTFWAQALQFPVESLLPSYKEENKSMHVHELA